MASSSSNIQQITSLGAIIKPVAVPGDQGGGAPSITVADGTTAVTLNAPEGLVVLTSADCAANTRVEAVLTNSFIRPGSSIMVGVSSANASWAPSGSAVAITAIPAAAGGSARIVLANGGATALGALTMTYWFRVDN
jgi:hypothetical protein